MKNKKKYVMLVTTILVLTTTICFSGCVKENETEKAKFLGDWNGNHNGDYVEVTFASNGFTSKSNGVTTTGTYVVTTGNIALTTTVGNDKIKVTYTYDFDSNNDAVVLTSGSDVWHLNKV